MLPSKDQAYQFAVMLQSGLPAADAILYFAQTDDPAQLTAMLRAWTRSREVKLATLELMGKAWQDMPLEERRDRALDHHYSQMAYFLYSTHYADLDSAGKGKADTARQALEAHKAGTSGKTDALSRFFDDISAGKLKLNVPLPRPH